MPRFFVPNLTIDKQEITVSGQEARHIQRVLRLGVGDAIELFDGTGKEYRGQITRHGRHALTVTILETTMPERESPLAVIMGQSLIKGDKMDFVIQKATEMGVLELIPFVSRRSVAHLHEGKIEQRISRWRRIAVESSKQCGRVTPLRVETVVGFDEILGRAPAEARRIVLWEKGTKRLKPLLQDTDSDSGPPRSVFFLVGPEGGFSEEEIRRAEAAHFVPVGLGSRILRVETAGLSFLSILQYEWGDLG